jgi:hypothetical protein
MNEIINGFIVLERLESNFSRVICKECKSEFITAYYSIKRLKSCGCARPKQLKPLPEYINGFKTIKCLGYDKVKMVRRAIVKCKICNKEYEVDPNKLKYRKHCGCMKKDVIACKYAKSHPQLAQTIKHMMARCYNKNNQDYYNYGARGITVCDEWLEDRNKFCEWALKNGFEEGKSISIDRIDSSKGYFPENCRWSNAIDQGRNTRRNVMTIELAREIREKSKEMKLSHIATAYGLNPGTVWYIVQNKTWRE